jgi:predicted component of type VI protein secretion system
MQVRIVYKSSSGKPPRTHSRGLPLIVGRSDADEIKLRIPRDSVSRRHCELFLDEQTGQVCIRDLESTNGTYVDGRQLKARVATPVSSGSTVKLGNVAFIVEYQLGSVGRSAHDSDTIPIDEATAAGEFEELEPVGPEPAAGVAPPSRSPRATSPFSPPPMTTRPRPPAPGPLTTIPLPPKKTPVWTTSSRACHDHGGARARDIGLPAACDRPRPGRRPRCGPADLDADRL